MALASFLPLVREREEGVTRAVTIVSFSTIGDEREWDEQLTEESSKRYTYVQSSIFGHHALHADADTFNDGDEDGTSYGGIASRFQSAADSE